jgi:hypothetical protein
MSSSNSNSNEVNPNNLLVLVGSGLLLVGIVKILHIVLPSKFGQDPAWEVATLGRLVGISPIPVIGISFIFYGESRWINLRLDKQETRFFLLKNLSRLSLLLSVGYLSVLLIAANASTRITRFAPTTTSLRFSQNPSQPAQKNLANGNNINLLNNDDLTAGRSPSVGADKPNVPNEINQPVAESATPKNESEENLQVIQAKENERLFEQIGKWYLEAIVSTLVLFGIWYQTEWARNPAKPKRKRSSHSSTITTNIDNESQSKDD